MYKLTVYIDDPNVDPITRETDTKYLEVSDISQHGIYDDKTDTFWPPHMIRKIKREEVDGKI